MAALIAHTSAERGRDPLNVNAHVTPETRCAPLLRLSLGSHQLPTGHTHFLGHNTSDAMFGCAGVSRIDCPAQRSLDCRGCFLRCKSHSRLRAPRVGWTRNLRDRRVRRRAHQNRIHGMRMIQELVDAQHCPTFHQRDSCSAYLKITYEQHRKMVEP